MTWPQPDALDPRYRDRADAGRELGARLRDLAGERPVVVGLPRGGVPVAYEVAVALEAPLDIVLVRKLGAPMHPELGMGAIGEEGVRVLNDDVVRTLGISREEIEQVAARERAELERRLAAYRGDRPPVPVAGRTVILVDDGIATGFTAKAAALLLRKRGAQRIVLAVPAGPPEAAARFSAAEVDEFVCLHAPEWFFSVGGCYEHFGQTSDEEVRALLERRQLQEAGVDSPQHAGGIDWSQVRHRDVQITAAGAVLAGDLRLPPAPAGLVIFAHGSGSSRLSPRNIQVAAALTASGFGTLLFDLLTDVEAADRRNVFDIGLLAERLAAAARWAQLEPELQDLPLGYFGASTGA
ncbi:MAG: phosphoribosyltransferase family protein, partial [Candidatus Limnocylindria bacterium]